MRKCVEPGIDCSAQARETGNCSGHANMQMGMEFPCRLSVIRISIWPTGRFLMCSSCARVSLMSVSLPNPMGSYLSSNTAAALDGQGAPLLRHARRRFEEILRCLLVRVCRSMVVFGAEETSSLKPRPTVRSCGSAWSANRNAVLVPRAVCRIWAKFE